MQVHPDQLADEALYLTKCDQSKLVSIAKHSNINNDHMIVRSAVRKVLTVHTVHASHRIGESEASTSRMCFLLWQSRILQH